MVSNDDGVGTDVTAQALEIVIAQVACRGLDALAVQPGIGQGVKMNAMKFHSKPCTELNDKLFVAVRLASPKVEVAMHRLNVIAFINHHQQQSDAVSAAAEGHEITALPG